MRYGIWVMIALLPSLGPGCSDLWYNERAISYEDGRGEWSDEPLEGGFEPLCFTSEDCVQQEVCASHFECVPVVAGCPLSDDCLRDPTMYVPAWRGADPWYAGDIIGEGFVGRLEVDLDFRDDHIYGEGVLFSRNDKTNFMWYEENEVFVTGTRDEGALWGQLVDMDNGYRFDAVFEATMPSSSEMIGEVTIVSDTGVIDAALHLWRLSPCGCGDAVSTNETEVDPTLL